MKKRSKKATEIRDYDAFDTSVMIDADKRLTFEDIGLELPPAPPTATPSRKPGAGTPVPTVEPTPTSLPVRDVRPVITRQVTRQAQIEAVSGVAWTQ